MIVAISSAHDLPSRPTLVSRRERFTIGLHPRERRSPDRHSRRERPIRRSAFPARIVDARYCAQPDREPLLARRSRPASSSGKARKVRCAALSHLHGHHGHGPQAGFFLMFPRATRRGLARRNSPPPRTSAAARILPPNCQGASGASSPYLLECALFAGPLAISHDFLRFWHH